MTCHFYSRCFQGYSDRVYIIIIIITTLGFSLNADVGYSRFVNISGMLKEGRFGYRQGSVLYIMSLCCYHWLVEKLFVCFILIKTA